MESKYENLLERTVVTQEGMLLVQRDLAKNMEKLNDNFVLHTKKMEDIECVVIKSQDTIQQAHALVAQYLKWAILAIIVLLGGQKLISIVSALT
jgi:tRNA 2-selenouridine synthase SelU